MFPIIDSNEFSNANEFQINVNEILNKYFKNLIPGILDEQRSFIDTGVFLDYILYECNTDNSICFSIRKDELFISGKYVDIYILAEETMEMIDSLCRGFLLGNYIVIMRYGKKRKFLEKEIVFSKSLLKKYNIKHKSVLSSIIGLSVAHEETIKGSQWIQV